MTTGDDFPTVDLGMSVGEVLVLVAAIVVTIVALAGIGFGGSLAVLDLSRRDATGLIVSDQSALSASGCALVTDDQTVTADSAAVPRHWLGTVRIRATSVAGDPVFLGIASTGDVQRYLSGVAWTKVTRIGEARPAYDHPGGRPSLAPADVPIWRTQSAGPGEQTITWPVENGDWTLVVMKPDGAPGLEVRVDIAATAPVVRWVWKVLLGTAGAALALATLTLAAVVVRPPKGGPSPLRQTPGHRVE